MRNKEFSPNTPAEALIWIKENEHHEGYIRALGKPQQGLVLVGKSGSCFIKKGLLDDNLIVPSDYDVTKRMYELTPAALELTKLEGNTNAKTNFAT